MLADLMAVTGLVTIYLILQFRFIAPPPGNDQLNYFKAASELPHVTTSHQEMRLGLLLPVRGLLEVFGPSEIAYYAVPFASAALLAGGTYWLGCLIFNRYVGMLSGVLVIANPYILRDSSHLLPDLLAASLLTTAVTLTIYTSRLIHDSEMSSNRQRIWGLMFVAGLLLGWAYLTREFIPIFFPLIPAILALRRVSQRWIIPVAIGAFIPFAFELVWNTLFHSHPLSRLMVAGGHIGSGRADTEPLAVAAIFWNELLDNRGGVTWIALAVSILVVPAIMRLLGQEIDRAPLVALLWFGGMWTFMTLVGFLPTLLLGEHATMLRIHKMRYWVPIFPALVVGGVGYLAALSNPFSRVKAAAWKVTLAVLLLLSAVVGVRDLQEISIWTTSGGSHYHDIRAVLSDDGERWDTIWAIDSVWRATTRALPMYTRSWWGRPIWHGRVEALNSGSGFREEPTLHGDLVVFHPRAISSTSGGYRQSWPGYVRTPPQSWRTEYVSSNGELALFTAMGAPTVTPLVESGDADWQVVGTSGWEIEDSRVLDRFGTISIDLAPRERAWLLDSQARDYESPAAYGQLPPGYARGSISISSSAGGSIAGSVPAGIPGGHRVRLFCLFYGPDGQRERALAVAAPFVAEQSSVGFVCPSVETEWTVTGARIGVHAVGPAELEIGSWKLWWEHLDDEGTAKEAR